MSTLTSLIPKLKSVMRFGRDYQAIMEDGNLLIFKEGFFCYTPTIYYAGGDSILVSTLIPYTDYSKLMTLFELELEKRKLEYKLFSIIEKIKILT